MMKIGIGNYETVILPLVAFVENYLKHTKIHMNAQRHSAHKQHNSVLFWY